MFKGTSASAGIGIGKAVIVEEAELVITRNEVEMQRLRSSALRGLWKRPLQLHRRWQTIWLPAWERRKQRSCRDT